MRLYLVRHGQTAWNLEQRAQGHCDTPLDEMGLQQAEQVANVLRGLSIERVLSSDLARSADTAKAIADALGLGIELSPLLRERDFGILEGQPYEIVRSSIEREAAQIGCEPFDYAPVEGESLRDVWNRIQPIVEELRACARRTVVVAHGGTIGLMLARLIDAGPESSRAFRITNASVTELYQRADGGWAIERLNDRTHLEVAREGFGTGA